MELYKRVEEMEERFKFHISFFYNENVKLNNQIRDLKRLIKMLELAMLLGSAVAMVLFTELFLKH